MEEGGELGGEGWKKKRSSKEDDGIFGQEDVMRTLWGVEDGGLEGGGYGGCGGWGGGWCGGWRGGRGGGWGLEGEVASSNATKAASKSAIWGAPNDESNVRKIHQ